MKITILASSLALCGSIALAQHPTTTSPQQTRRAEDKKTGAPSMLGDHQLTAEVVSTDAAARQLTVRKLVLGSTVRSTGSASTAQLPPMDGGTFTLKVDGMGLTSLSSFKAGDQVTLSCRPMGGAAPGTSAGSGMGSITSQAMADAHCAAVTDISAARITY